MPAYCTNCQKHQKVARIFRKLPDDPQGKTDFICHECVAVIATFQGEINISLNDFSRQVHKANQTWWHDPATGAPLDRNFGEMIALCHSELSEALEGHRKDLMDDKLPHRKMVEVELVDCLIRIFDLADARGFDLQGAYEEKMAYNAARADHKPENRVKPGGKAY